MQQKEKAAGAAYTAVMKHSEDSIRRLTKVQYNAYQVGKKFLFLLAGGVLILVAVFGGMSLSASGVIAFIGCMIIWFSNFPAQLAAAQMNRAINGKYPRVEYYFFDEAVDITDGKEWFTLPYKGIQRFFEDKEYWYFFLTTNTSYMIPKSTLKKGDASKFTTFIENRCGLKAEKPVAALNIRLGTLIRHFRNKRALRKNRQ